MRKSAFLSFLLLPIALVAQAPSLGDRVKAARPAVEQLMTELSYPEAMTRAEALLPATRPAFDKTNNQTLVQGCTTNLDLAAAYRLAAEAADSAGAWEKALEYAKAAKSLADESYEAVKEPFKKMVDYYNQAGLRAKQVLDENVDRIKELKAKPALDPGERQELDLVLGVEKELVDDPKWAKFFQTFVDVSKRDGEIYVSLVKVMEDKLKSEADQILEYKAGKGEKTKWVDAVISTPSYLEAQGDKAGRARWLYRLLVLDPESKKVHHQLDVLFGRVPAKKGKKA